TPARKLLRRTGWFVSLDTCLARSIPASPPWGSLLWLSLPRAMPLFPLFAGVSLFAEVPCVFFPAPPSAVFPEFLFRDRSAERDDGAALGHPQERPQGVKDAENTHAVRRRQTGLVAGDFSGIHPLPGGLVIDELLVCGQNTAPLVAQADDVVAQ